jgi:hypothetical protein
MALLDAIQGRLGQSGVDQISRQLGVNSGLAQTAIAAALPMIVAGMAKHASQPDGATAIQQAAEAHQDVPDNVGEVLQAGPPADTSTGGGLLGRIMGQHHSAVQDGIQRATGLDGDKTRKLLMMLSPIVLGMLARQHFGGQQQADPAQINNTLQQEAQSAQQQVQRQSPHIGGILGQIFGSL